MSDLCHNCFGSHLPTPCALPLKLCEICKHIGHDWHFCPLGVHLKDPAYFYYMQCHNCNAWHLPESCLQPLHKCLQCTHWGHLECFCPEKAIRRIQVSPFTFASNDKNKTGVKREPTDGRNASEMSRSQSAVMSDADLIHAVSYYAVKEALSLTAAYTHDQILEIFSMPMLRLGPVMPLVYQTLNDTGDVIGGSASNSTTSKLNPMGPRDDVSNPATGFPALQGGGGGNSQTSMTPATENESDASVPRDQGAGEGVYSFMHERFNRGELADQAAFMSTFDFGKINAANSNTGKAQDEVAAIAAEDTDNPTISIASNVDTAQPRGRSQQNQYCLLASGEALLTDAELAQLTAADLDKPPTPMIGQFRGRGA